MNIIKIAMRIRLIPSFWVDAAIFKNLTKILDCSVIIIMFIVLVYDANFGYFRYLLNGNFTG